MTLQVALNHQTRYRYDRPIEMGPQVIRLRPAPHSRTPVPSYSLKVEPKEHFLNWQQDPHGNYLARARVSREGDASSSSRWISSPRWRCVNPFDFFLEPERREVSVRSTSRSCSRTSSPYLASDARRRRCSKKWLARSARQDRRAHDRFPRRAEPAAPARNPLHDPHGARRADAGGDAGAALAARAATRAGCSCRCCATSGSRRASSRAT